MKIIRFILSTAPVTVPLLLSIISGYLINWLGI